MADIKLSNVVKSYGDTTVIHGVDLDIKKGEFVVFVGPSGCGKSTLLRLIAGLEEITDGVMEIDNQVVNHVDPAERGIAMVFQSYALYPHLTVEENMGFGMKMNGFPKAEIKQRVDRAAKALQLDHLMDRKPKDMSGGQRQRVAIGRAIVRNPKVFLFDEPLSNLDAELRVDMRLQIASLHRELDTTMVYVTHDQVEAMTLADKIVVLRDGKVEQVGSPLELYNHPANEFVAGFIGSPKMNMLPALVTAADEGNVTISLPDGQSVSMKADSRAVSEGDKVSFGLRPEHIAVDGSGEATLHFTTHAVERLGNSTYLFGMAAGFDNYRVHISGDIEVARQDELTLSFNLSDCHLFFDSLCISNG
ncbi:ABC transporter [Vibrio sp. 10N.286.49.C2]|uniref:ABC transporter ATP-binding protein n=1 Tax=unclassified Vibrio TaxID=2614977 RepID=UPI000C864CC5|nr:MULTISPECIES: sn-glycerol-3-phosphate ABC transporter ATP-binding protein UgpC [unclassified Vibrio]PMH29609.1 ABC transporter [Vibrio sp. 10N.286.49.C2]PMH56125.1 ABC transporter [Vibrio sp. 10N.286.49.B1]PMH81049.1 ABC transporter [Vibrio sp. 10N.286.48.B7]